MGKRTFLLGIPLLLAVIALGGWRWHGLGGNERTARATVESALLDARVAVHDARMQLERHDYANAAERLSDARSTLASARAELDRLGLTGDLDDQLAIAVACIDSADRMTRVMQVISGTPVNHRPNQLGGKS